MPATSRSRTHHPPGVYLDHATPWSTAAVTALVEPSDPSSPPSLEELREFGRSSLAGYKLPKHLVLVDEIRRSPAGKADYRWAREVAEADRDRNG